MIKAREKQLGTPATDLLSGPPNLCMVVSIPEVHCICRAACLEAGLNEALATLSLLLSPPAYLEVPCTSTI